MASAKCSYLLTLMRLMNGEKQSRTTDDSVRRLQQSAEILCVLLSEFVVGECCKTRSAYRYRNVCSNWSVEHHCRGNRDGKCASYSRRRIDRDLRLMRLYDPFCDGQTETAAPVVLVPCIIHP